MSDRKPLRSRAHIHVNRFISLSLPLDEVFEAAATVARRVMFAVRTPRVGKNVKARIADLDMDHFAEDERDRILMDTERTLTGLGFKKAQARAAIDKIRPDMLGKKSHEVVAAALKATQPPPGEPIEATSSATQRAGSTGGPGPDGAR